MSGAGPGCTAAETRQGGAVYGKRQQVHQLLRSGGHGHWMYAGYVLASAHRPLAGGGGRSPEPGRGFRFVHRRRAALRLRLYGGDPHAATAGGRGGLLQRRLRPRRGLCRGLGGGADELHRLLLGGSGRHLSAGRAVSRSGPGGTALYGGRPSGDPAQCAVSVGPGRRHRLHSVPGCRRVRLPGQAGHRGAAHHVPGRAGGLLRPL